MQENPGGRKGGAGSRECEAEGLEQQAPLDAAQHQCLVPLRRGRLLEVARAQLVRLAVLRVDQLEPHKGVAPAARRDRDQADRLSQREMKVYHPPTDGWTDGQTDGQMSERAPVGLSLNGKIDRVVNK